MINFPKKYHKVPYYLRNSYQKLILKYGIKPKYLNTLKKILRIEAYISGIFPVPVNIENYCSQLFTAIFLKKDFDYFINTKGNFSVDKKLFTTLLLEISQWCDYLEITVINSCLVLKGNFKITMPIKILTHRLGGVIFGDLKREIYYLKFNFPATQKENGDIEKAYSMLQNPLSAVNIYLR